jgi:FtsP/CotA-like multicopper oxidase with cupredoxin domain
MAPGQHLLVPPAPARPDGAPEPAWRDMMNVPGGTRRRFRVQFSDYPGRTVYHCHRVAHGDLGMMGVLEMERPPILPPRMRNGYNTFP